MAAYAANSAYQAYYQQYAAAMAAVSPAELQARAAMYAQMRYPYGTAYPYGAYVQPGVPGLPYIPPPGLFPIASASTSYSPSTTVTAAPTATSTPLSNGTPLVGTIGVGPPIAYTPPNTAIPLTLPSAALESLKASGIVPVPSQDLPHAGLPQPAVVLLNMSADNSIANVTINLALLEPDQRGKLSAVLQSLVKGNAASGG